MIIQLVGINARYTHSCLALFYLRNELARHAPEAVTQLRQFTINDPPYDTLQRLAEAGTDYFFFSAQIWNSDLVERLVGDLLCIGPDWRIVVGGPQAERVGERYVDEPRLAVFSGAIEAAPPEFYRDVCSGELHKHYRGLFPGSGVKRLDYPYRPEDFSSHLLNRYVYYESSRGCPFSCTYCLSSAEKGLFHKPLDQVFAEIDDILEHRPKTVRFVDRTFNDVEQRALDIWRYLVQKDPDTLFHFEMAPDRFAKEMLDFLGTVRPGLFQFEIGIQSTNPATLAAIRRPVDTGAAHRNIKRLRAAENIHLHVDLILGLPEETAATFKTSINEVFCMEPHYIQMGLLKLLPDTAIAMDSSANRYRASSRPPYNVFSNRWMDPSTLKAFYWLGECLEHYVNNRYFPTLWRYLAGKEEDMAVFFERLRDLLITRGQLWLSHTQETLSSLLLDALRQRQDFPIIRELLCYDWLRCGHRYLPDHLSGSMVPLDELRRQLYHRLPETIDGLYQQRDRSHVIKKSVFQRFSAEALTNAGFSVKQEAIVCFSPEREARVNRLQKVILIQNFI